MHSFVSAAFAPRRRLASAVLLVLVLAAGPTLAQGDVTGYDTSYRSPRSSNVTSTHITSSGGGQYGGSYSTHGPGNLRGMALEQRHPYISSCAAGPADGVPSTTSSRRLVVVDPDGQPLSGVETRFAQWNRPEACRQLLTDATGTVQLRPQRASKAQLLELRAPGYAPLSLRLTGLQKLEGTGALTVTLHPSEQPRLAPFRRKWKVHRWEHPVGYTAWP